MNNRIFTFGLLVISALLFTSCQKEDLSIFENEYPNVDAELWSYFKNFEDEAAKRGFEIDIIASGITAEIGETAASTWVGQCNHNHDHPNHIIINEDFWNTASKMRKEKIIFHELGHCLLERAHNEEMLPNGHCKSLMRSGTGACIDNYTNNTKSYYLDELFQM